MILTHFPEVFTVDISRHIENANDSAKDIGNFFSVIRHLPPFCGK